MAALLCPRHLAAYCSRNKKNRQSESSGLAVCVFIASRLLCFAESDPCELLSVLLSILCFSNFYQNRNPNAI